MLALLQTLNDGSFFISIIIIILFQILTKQKNTKQSDNDDDVDDDDIDARANASSDCATNAADDAINRRHRDHIEHHRTVITDRYRCMRSFDILQFKFV